MSLVISSVFTYDTDAGNYIQAVEAADGQALESATRKAINDFVIGCKQDGIWDAIKASCILSGARTLAGALVPLVGVAPTNYNFVAGDYNRKTGLVGDGSTKYLDSNRNNNADPQNSNHNAVYISTAATNTAFYIGSGTSTGDNSIYRDSTRITVRTRSANVVVFSGYQSSIRLLGSARTGASSSAFRANNQILPFSEASQTPSTGSLFVFSAGVGIPSNARIAFYSIGESLDLAKLDGRVTDLINKFSQVIP